MQEDSVLLASFFFFEGRGVVLVDSKLCDIVFLGHAWAVSSP